MEMEWNEMQAKWAEFDRKLDASMRLNQRLLNAVTLNRARTALQRTTFGLAIETALQIIVVVWLGSFVYDHLAVARFALPGIALDVLATALLASMIRQIAGIQMIDYGRPITEIQRDIQRLRLLSIRSTQWVFLTAPLVWPLLIIVAMKGFLGVDAYQAFGEKYIAANLLFGALFIPLALTLSQALSERYGNSPFFHGVLRTLAGHNLNAAVDFLRTLSDFDRDEG